MNELSPWRIRRLAGNEEIQPEFSRVSEPDEIPLSSYWDILVKRRNVILSIFFVVFAAGAYFALSATTLYTATATIKIEPQTPRVTGVVDFQPLESGREYDYHKTQFALLKNRALAARVITELDLEANQSFTNANIVTPNPAPYVMSWLFRPLRFLSSYMTPLFKSESKTKEPYPSQSAAVSGKLEPELKVSPRLINRYLGFIAIVPISQTRLVSIQSTTPDPSLSQALANAHVQAFMRMSEEGRFSLTQVAQEFLEQKKTELQKKLEESEADLNRFERAHNVLSVGKGENIVVDRLVDLNKQLTAARAQRIEAESLYQTVQNRSYQDLSEVMRQGLVQQLKGNLATLEAENARVATTFKPDHPRIQQLNHQISEARQALNNEIVNVVQGIRSNYAATLAKERALESEAQKQQGDALKLRELGVQYTVLQEEVKANRTLYESVLKRLSETSVVNDVAVSNMQIVERAAKPSGPSGPNVPLYLLASIVSGLFLGIAAAFVREFFDSTIGTPEKVWRSVGLGTLGAVPHVKFLSRPTYRERQIEGRKQADQAHASPAPARELITDHGPLSIMNEAYRTIRTFLLLSQADKPPQVILLTSPSPGEGKTVTSLNLAIALARDGHTVLLVDADMRQGCCHNRLGLTNNRGLSNVLTGGLLLDEGIQDTPVSGLSLLSRGIPPPNPSELLGSRRMKDILKELRQRFEFILIDSPPVIALSDAAILSVITDGVVLVFDGQRTSTASAQKAVELLDVLRVRFLGVILNAVNLDNPAYSYHRTYKRYDQDSSDTEEVNERSAKESNGRAAMFENTGENKNGLQAESRKTLTGKIKVREMINRAAQSIQEVYKGVSLNDEENGKSASQNREDDCAKPFGNEAFAMNEGAFFKPTYVPATTAAEIAPWQMGKPDGAVSQLFLNRLMDIFMESVGPVAPYIVGHHIGLLGESKEAFPKSRIDELVRSLAPEIEHPEVRLRFETKITKEIRNLENQ
jgi:polysaccharide biosynthesis transport protein